MRIYLNFYNCKQLINLKLLGKPKSVKNSINLQKKSLEPPKQSK